ncbi:MAG: hypothetical protein NT084_08775 [Bacteroidetes bacterium]|nr:hypothetical protein [Bacteroidota bacterium]
MESSKPNVESMLDTHQELPKIFREKPIYIATFLGGPLAAGYIMAHNFKIFGEPAKAKMAWLISILVSILLLWMVMKMPTSVKIPNQLIPLIYTGIAYGLVYYYQGRNIETHLKKGGKYFSGWRVAGVTSISLVILCALIFSGLYFTDVTLNSSCKAYGLTENKIYYKSSNITVAELDKIAKTLEDVGEFTNDKSIDIYVKKGVGNYAITYTLMGKASEDPEIIKYFESERNKIQKEFPSDHIIIQFSSEGKLDDVVKILN